ncbi:uncharacterized protein N0V89_007472 [Didymosphaeria variabile]|uniref:Uncharacterized protein n=1 Tax=Didymosphaeria variabile TaxID=1932322 RepID=A0A9W8XK65_9PLEO|nr:uncharacterized protein N0V89_007472 [Didymosphaeria variabile]KAJ4352126.1 hypothetical protein N0V89_007472 [Didymosphaeria variabile]
MPLTWKETRPGRWERPQSCLEKINLLNRNVDKALDRDNWAKTAVAKVEFDSKLEDPEHALKQAWKQVRYNYPEVAAFPYEGTYMYRIGNPEQVQLWVSATFVIERNTSIDELFGHLPRNEQMMCYYLPDTSEILVRSPHYRLDARGAIFILNYLIKSLANPDPVLIFGGCAGNLSPSIDDALNIPFEYNAKIEEAAAKRLASLEPHNPLIELTPNAKPNRAGATRRRFIRLSEAETKSITKGAKSAGMDYTAAMHAAVIAAVVRLAPPTEVQSYMASFHCDLRYLIPKSSKTKAAPTVCTDAITTEVEVSPTTDLNSYYKQLAPGYAAGYAPYLESTACFHEQLAKKKYADGKGYEFTDGQAQPRLGPLGIIDDQLTKQVKGVVRVKDFWLGGETLTKRKMVHNWIWEDQMVFSCCYNEKYWDDQFVEHFLQTIKDVLMEEVAKTSSSSLSSKLKGMMLK